jgi:hypothetical protein
VQYPHCFETCCGKAEKGSTMRCTQSAVQAAKQQTNTGTEPAPPGVGAQTPVNQQPIKLGRTRSWAAHTKGRPRHCIRHQLMYTNNTKDAILTVAPLTYHLCSLTTNNQPAAPHEALSPQWGAQFASLHAQDVQEQCKHNSTLAGHASPKLLPPGCNPGRRAACLSSKHI